MTYFQVKRFQQIGLQQLAQVMKLNGIPFISRKGSRNTSGKIASLALIQLHLFFL